MLFAAKLTASLMLLADKSFGPMTSLQEQVRRLSCRRNLKQDLSQSASAADVQKRSYFSPVRYRQEVLFALWECRNSDSETSERRGIMHDFIASDGPDRLDLQALGVYG